MSMQSLGFAAQSVAGRIRRHNEDALLCLPELRLWAVADGMGGHQCGEVASALALEVLRDAVADGGDLEAAIHAAHQAILEAVQEESGRRMGSTVVAARFADAEFEIAWIGDSRAYHLSLDGIARLTHDHSWVQAMIDAGEMNADEARRHPRRNIVTQCLGQAGQPLQVGRVQGRLAPGELLLLCSDGLTGELNDEQIQEVCADAATLDALVDELVGLANRMGGRDNISCIVLGRSMAESTKIDAGPRNFFSRWLHSRKHRANDALS